MKSVGAPFFTDVGMMKNAFIVSTCRRSRSGILKNVAGDLLQRAHQVLRCAGDQGGAAIGGELAVARDREDEDLAEEVGDDGHEQDDQPDRNGVVVPARPPPPNMPP